MKTVFGTERYQIEACPSETGNGKGQTIEGISLLLLQEGRIKLENGQLVSVELTKEDARAEIHAANHAVVFIKDAGREVEIEKDNTVVML